MGSPERPTGGKVKGAPIRAMCEAWAELRGRPEVVDAIRDLELRDRKLFDSDQARFGILPSTWYSAVTCGHLVDRLFREVSPVRRNDFVASLSRGMMNRTLRGVHKAVFRVVGSPELIRRRGQLFWNQQFDSGRVSISKTGSSEQLHEYFDWAGHHPMMCRISFYSVPVMFELMGVNPPITIALERCAADEGADSCAARVQW